MKKSLLSVACLALLCGCRPQGSPAFSVMTYNVHQYTLTDRDGDGVEDDPKPDAERMAVVKLIAQENPDVLLLQEMGDAGQFMQFREDLKSAGIEYGWTDLLQRGNGEANLALLSRLPVVSVQHRTNDWYSIGEAKVAVARGFLDAEIQVTAQYRFRLIGVHLKSKVYSPLGQTEMRRNEARLLNKAVREILEGNPGINLLVAGDMNDDYASAALREVAGRRGGELTDLRPVDSVGDAWTCFSRSSDSFSRFDYFFVSEGMLPEVIRDRTHVVRSPLTYLASDHRPVVAVFAAEDQGR
ncbi:MAG: endonuclease/exonuclease/phosphatase family protein [Kiritimatiellales bacterium]